MAFPDDCHWSRNGHIILEAHGTEAKVYPTHGEEFYSLWWPRRKAQSWLSLGAIFWPQTQREIDLGESCHWGQKSRQIERRRVRNSITDRAQLTQRPGLPCEVLHYLKAVWVGFYLSQNNSIKVLSCIWILVSHLSWQTVNVVLIRRSWFIPANNTLFLGKRCGHLYFSWLKEEIIISILKHYFKGLIRPYS